MYKFIFIITSFRRFSLSLSISFSPCLPTSLLYSAYFFLQTSPHHSSSQMSPTFPFFLFKRRKVLLFLWNRLLNISASVLKPLYRHDNFGFQCIFVYQTIIEKGKMYMVHRALRKNKFSRKYFISNIWKVNYYKFVQETIIHVKTCHCRNIEKISYYLKVA